LRGKQYTAFNIVVTLLEEVALLATVLWLLPILGINISIWVLVLLMIAWGAYSYMTYRLTKKVQDKEIPTPAEAMIGRKGKVVKSLDQVGIVRIGGELWTASVADPPISAGEEIIVMGIRGLLLSVARVEFKK